MTTGQVSQACKTLAVVKEQIKTLEDQEKKLRNMIVSYLGENDSLMDLDGSIIATFKSAKDGKKLDSELLEKEMPEIYARYQKVVAGSRRFLLK